MGAQHNWVKIGLTEQHGPPHGSPHQHDREEVFWTAQGGESSELSERAAGAGRNWSEAGSSEKRLCAYRPAADNRSREVIAVAFLGRFFHRSRRDQAWLSKHSHQSVPRLAPSVPNTGTEVSGLLFKTSRGHCRPFGASLRPGGVNFAVFSRHAHSVHLVLFKEGREEPIAEIPLDPVIHKTGDVWHIFVHGLPPDILYGYRVNGPFAPKAGHRFNPRQIVLDPYARGHQRRTPLGRADVPHGSGNGTGRLTRRGRLVVR